MERDLDASISKDPADTRIDALLNAGAGGSIVDSLFAFPDMPAGAAAGGEWETAVSVSLQRRLAQAVRRAIEREDRADTRHAA